MKKPDSMSCGSACIYYLQENLFHIESLNCPNELFWMCDLANFLLDNTSSKISLSCFRSKLYLDYCIFGYKNNFEGFRSINSFLKHNMKIHERKVSINSIDKLLNEKKYLILNVSSSMLNQDMHLNGGHYICIIGKQETKYIIVNPKSQTIDIEQIDKKLIVNSCNCYGNWMLEIKRC